MRQAGAVAWYRFRATWRRRWPGYLSVVLVIGLIGGVAMASVAGARRTQSSFGVFLAKTNPSDVAVLTGLYQPDPSGYDAGLVAKISRLRYVQRVESQGGYEFALVNAQGYQIKTPQVTLDSSLDGQLWNQDRLVVLDGRLPNPSSPDQVVVNSSAQRLLGVRIGSRLHIGVAGNKQSSTCQHCKPTFRATVTVVGVVTSSPDLVVDDVDRNATMYATQAFARQTLSCCVDPTISYVKLQGGTRHLSVVESEITRLLPAHLPRVFVPTASASEATAQRVIGPDVVALYIFGLIVALVALLVAGQMIGRQLRLGSEDGDALRALGADPATTMLDGLVGTAIAVVTGTVLAAVIAVALSPLMPIGPVGPVYPDPGLSFDGLVLGVGVVVLVVVLGLIAVVIARVQAPHRSARRRERSLARSSVAVRTAMTLGLPATAVAGVQFAAVPGRGRSAAPVRSAVVGAVVAVAVVAASLTVGASMDTLASHPRLYGWNWTVAFTAAGGVGVLPRAQMIASLDADRDVTAWSSMDFSQMQFDGRNVAVLGSTPRARVAPPLISGHGLDGPGQVVLGLETIRQLGKRVGEYVSVGAGGRATKKLLIVGTATFPAFGGNPHPEMGTGALVDYKLIPESSRNIFNLPGGGPNAAFVRLRGSPSAGATARLRAIAATLSRAAQDYVNVITVQRPAEIADSGTLRATPTFLASALAAGAVLALALTLVATVRRRRRDLALLKVLGFTRRQVATAVAWQSSIAALFGVVVGLPLGVVAGRALWRLFATGIYAVPDPVTPIVAVALVGVGAMAFAVLVSWLPGRSAARTPPALVLRSE